MEPGATEVNQRLRDGAPPGLRRPGGWSRQPQHRRRRALALAGLVAILLIALLVPGGGGARHGVLHASSSGFFGRLARLAGSGPASLAGRLTAAENAAINRTLAFTPFVRVAGAQHREVALTFDDGPGPYTPQIVSILQREQVPATFFEVGVMEQYFSASTTQIAAIGDAIGDHTFTHTPMSHLSRADQRRQLVSAAATLVRYGAPFPRLFRPPYGVWNSTTLSLLRRYRMLMVLWTVESSDYRRPGVRAIVHATLSGARPGAIILLHDAGGNRSQTVAALPKIIAGLRARGYRLVTVPQLLLDNPPPAEQNIGKLSGSGA